MRYKVVIPTSGVGSRLGHYTDYTNKSLVKVGDKPIISHVIEKYPDDVEIVVTLGYKGKLVRDFLEIAYPKRRFTFVNVDNYCGEGSSLVYSLLQTRDYIDCPFIYHACDTIITDENIPEPNVNWIGGSTSADSTEYTSLSVTNGHVSNTYPKGEKCYDYVYVGISGFYNYRNFFEMAERFYSFDRQNKGLSDIDVSRWMLQDGVKFRYENFDSWLDVGNVDKLKKACSLFGSRTDVLSKETEAIYFVGDKVIKFFSDGEIAKNRIKRAGLLNKKVPNVKAESDNFYSYDYVQGELLSKIIDENLMLELLMWAESCLWKSRESIPNDFYLTCKRFYFDKTISRMQSLLDRQNFKDIEDNINGLIVPNVSEMLDKIDCDWLCNVSPYTIHGDFILDNILYDDGRFVLLDWRQDFGGDLYNGDMYYDLAKLNHNLTFNHEIVNKGGYSVTEDNGRWHVDLMMSYRLASCRKVFHDFLLGNGYDLKKVELLTALVWLNMSPLHEYPLDIFLYYFGKLNLFKAMNDA